MFPPANPIPERDWRFLRSIEDELLAILCARINQQTAKILTDPQLNERQKYHAVYKHIKESGKIVTDCFDDWKRSDINIKIMFLNRHNLFKPEHLARLSDESKHWLRDPFSGKD